MRAGTRAPASVVLFAAALASLFISAPAQAAPECTASLDRSLVRMETNLGPIEILLCDVDVPVTVANFLQYVDEGAYTQTGFVHRSVQAEYSIVQGGGFFISGATFVAAVVTRPPIALELAGLKNLRGTIAMARTSALDSATSQWFINTQDNSEFDEGNPEGNPPYAVFGEIVLGMEVVDAMAAQGIWQLNPTLLSEVPLIDYPEGGADYLDYLVYVTDVVLGSGPPPEVPAAGPGAQLLLAMLMGAAGLAGLARRRRS